MSSTGSLSRLVRATLEVTRRSYCVTSAASQAGVPLHGSRISCLSTFTQTSPFRNRRDLSAGIAPTFAHQHTTNRLFATVGTGSPNNPHDRDAQKLEKPEEKESLWQRFKSMYKQYWYVLIPVHGVTSAFWFGTFYYAAKSGIDIVPLLENLGANEYILSLMRDTGAGYIAVAYGMYKIATPVRYTVTLAGTTLSINYLRQWGYIKPMPSSEQMKEMIMNKRTQLRSSRAKVLARMNLRKKRPQTPSSEHTTKDKQD